MFKNSKSIGELPRWQVILAVLTAFSACILAFYYFSPPSVDWKETFFPVSRDLLHPYRIRTYNYVPWGALLLSPFQFLSTRASTAVVAALNFLLPALLIIRRKGGLLPLALTLTCLPMLLAIFNGSLEWIPVLGFLLQNGWGLPLLLVKPQSGSLAMITWFIASKDRLKFLLPVGATLLLSFLVWGNWPAAWYGNIHYLETEHIGFLTVNTAPWPWAIPIGVGLIIYLVLRKPADMEFLGALATACLVPYFFPHSLVILFALLSLSHRRIAVLVWVLLWIYPLVVNWSLLVQYIGRFLI
jgi:hypothetical protein